MKKILALISVLIFSTTAYANNRLDGFNKWLFENGYSEYVKKVESAVCKAEPKYSNMWYYNKCGQPQYENNLKIKFYEDSSWLPEETEKPNFDTLLFELYKYTYSPYRDKPTVDVYEVKPSKKPYKFKSKLKEDKYIDKQLEKTALLSYLRFEDNKIMIDKFTPDNRFGRFINKNTKLRSMSAGKTMVSYVVGHAICDGYIENINSRFNDWPLLENTLYYDQKLIDILNMNSGDQKYIVGSELSTSVDKNLINEKFRGLDDNAIDFKQYISLFKNTKKSKPYFNYSGMNPTLALNYVLFKTGDDFEKILEKTFKKKAKIKDSVIFWKVKNSSKESGNANIMFYATRYDYLRIAKAMLDDWQNDTCVGKYLKTIFDNRIDKENEKRNKEGRPGQYRYASGYAGQFQVHYKGISKKRAIMGMHGRGGQHIVIDFERSRIVVTNAIYENFNFPKIVYQLIKNGS
jgi:CubicO group peptidase (beta-lactamase class C family)